MIAVHKMIHRRFSGKAAAEDSATHNNKKQRRGSSIGQSKKRLSLLGKQRKSDTAASEHPSVAVVRKVLQAWNDHKLQKTQKYITDDFCICFVDQGQDSSNTTNATITKQMSWTQFSQELQSILNSFGDFQFEPTSLEYNALNRTVVVHEMIMSGHHTGQPFSLLSSNVVAAPNDGSVVTSSSPSPPSIAALGTFVENSPETLTFHFLEDDNNSDDDDDNNDAGGGVKKIHKIVSQAHGDMTGPSSIYTQLGGVL